MKLKKTLFFKCSVSCCVETVQKILTAPWWSEVNADSLVFKVLTAPWWSEVNMHSLVFTRRY